MSNIRLSILKQALHKELAHAKQLEKEGKEKEAGIHYMRASMLYRKLAYLAPREHAEMYFSNAGAYENLGNAMRFRSGKARKEKLAMVEQMIVSEKPDVGWDDIGDLEGVKEDLRESVLLPMIKNKPEFVKAPNTILLYGPPGNGKTMLAKAACNMLNATFFEANTSSLLSKYFGESSKIISALFDKARTNRPAIIFIDEIDSVAMKRSSDMDDSSRRVVSQILMEIDGFKGSEEGVVIIAATNKPWDLDDAIISRFQKRIYIPLPGKEARAKIFEVHLSGAEIHGITANELAEMSNGYSGRDIEHVCREAIMKMIRDMNPEIKELNAGQIEKYELKYRPLNREDFEHAFSKIKPSVDKGTIKKYEEWDKNFSAK